MPVWAINFAVFLALSTLLFIAFKLTEVARLLRRASRK